MKVVMINDCAFVGETIIKYLPEEFKVTHVKRSRQLFDKTLGIAWKIFRSKGDLYHVHYLLQDCYLALKFGKKPIIGHAHGTDLRKAINHKVWGRIVKFNLKNCNAVLVSTPDILEKAKKYNKNAEYIPNPVDTSIFYPKPLAENKNRKMRVLIAGKLDWEAKGSNIAIEALSKIKDYVEVFVIKYGKDFDKTLKFADSLGLRLHILEKVSHRKIREYYWDVDVVIDQFPRSGTLGMVTLEAIACGRPVITYVSSQYSPYEEFPLKDVNTTDKIVEVLLSGDLTELWKKQHKYLLKNHCPYRIVRQLQKIYLKL